MKIKVGELHFNVKLAITNSEKEKGLQNIKNLPEDEGLLFVYEDTQDEVSFWMKNTYIPLDIVFINEDDEVISIAQGDPLNLRELIIENDVALVLEVNSNSGIKIGDEIEFLDDEFLDQDTTEIEDNDTDDDTDDEENEKIEDDEVEMQVLNSKGKSQMSLKGGERIFSRIHTKKLVELAKIAYESKNEDDYKNLGLKAFKFLTKQDNNEDQYVEKKEKH